MSYHRRHILSVGVTTQYMCAVLKLDKWHQHAKRTSNDPPPELRPLDYSPRDSRQHFGIAYQKGGVNATIFFS